MVSSKVVANKFLELANRDGKAIGILKMIKLVFLAHGWALGNYSRPLIDDKIEAWKYGPVIPNLYHAIKKYRRSFIKKPILCFGKKDLSPEDEAVIEKVYEIYSDYSPIELSNLTHEENTPWDIVHKEHGENAEIPMSLIEHYYKQRIVDIQANQGSR